MQKYIHYGVLLFGLVAASLAVGANVFIDPSRNEGCPGAGLESDPYCDWLRVKQFVGGNRYLQKSGTVYHGSITILGNTGATAGKPVFIGAYGSGLPPKIRIESTLPGAMDTGKWKRVRSDIWVYSTAGFRIANPEVLLLDGRRAFGNARQRPDLCREQGAQTVEWFHTGDTLFLCSPRGNPAEVYQSISGMQRVGSDPWAPVYLEDQHHVVIDGIALEGGSSAAVEIRGESADIEIRNCVIGLDSASGIRAKSFARPIRRLDIHDNLIDSGIRWGAVAYEPELSGEGLHLLGGVEDSKVYRNRFVAWSHNGIYLDAHLPNAPGVRNNRVFDNEFYCGPGSSYFDYCRPFGIDGFQAGFAEHNLVVNNRMHDFSVAAQVNGNDNYMIGNLCYNVVNSRTRRFPTGQCFSLQPYKWSTDNLIANNTMVNTADVAVQFIPGNAGVSSGHRIVNNIMYGCGLATKPTRRDVCVAIEPGSSVGPQTLEDNLMYNPGRPVRVLYRRPWSEIAGDVHAKSSDTLTGNRVFDPMFRDPENGDFSLMPGSPAIGAAIPMDVPGLNVANAFPDIGALQSTRATGWEVVE